MMFEDLARAILDGGQPAKGGSCVTEFPVCESSATVRERVVAARARQTVRLGDAVVRVNAGLSGRALRRHCSLDKDGARLLEAAIRRLALSARGYDRVVKVARTIADLGGADQIEAAHIAEALQYRMVE